jgi:glycosyltransferase involved in cell wall biosynthesis
MIRVLHVLRFLHTGGASRSACAIAGVMEQAGRAENRILSLLPATAGGLCLARQAGLPVLDAPGAEELRREMAAADVVQVHWWNNPQTDELLRGDLPPMRLLVFVHVAGDSPPHAVTRELVEVADFVVAGCGYAHRNCAAIQELPAGERRRRTAVVPATSDFRRLGKPERRPRDTFNVGYLGTLELKKIHPAFVAMSARVRVPGVRFLVGGKGPSDVLERQARELAAADRFRFLGYVEEVGAALAEMDVFGYPLGERPGAELSVQEALYAGVPPVVFPLGGLQDAVIHGETGLVVESEDEYVAAIERLFHHPQERRRLSENARTFARRTFGAFNSARKMARVYARLMRAPKRTRQWGDGAGPGLGAARFAESLGEAGAPFRACLRGGADGELQAAEARIAAASPVMQWALEQYHEHYPDDPHLRLWRQLAGDHPA